jgi:hypothetical protein
MSYEGGGGGYLRNNNMALPATSHAHFVIEVCLGDLCCFCRSPCHMRRRIHVI